MKDELRTLAGLVEAVTLRIRTLGLSRAADDLLKVSSELRRLQGAEENTSPRIDTSVRSDARPER